MDICGREYDYETEKLVALLLFYRADTYIKDEKDRDAVEYAQIAGNHEAWVIIRIFFIIFLPMRNPIISCEAY